MDTTRTAADEQRQVRLTALGVMLTALVVAAVLVALQAWTVAAAATVIGLVAWWWAAKLYGDLKDQAMQEQAMANAANRFNRVPPATAVPDPFEK